MFDLSVPQILHHYDLAKEICNRSANALGEIFTQKKQINPEYDNLHSFKAKCQQIVDRAEQIRLLFDSRPNQVDAECQKLPDEATTLWYIHGKENRKRFKPRPQQIVDYNEFFRVVMRDRTIRNPFDTDNAVHHFASLRLLYSKLDLQLISNEAELNKLLVFTAWLNDRCGQLCKDAESLCLEVESGTEIDANKSALRAVYGNLLLHFQDLQGNWHEKWYTYIRRIKNRGGTPAYALSLKDADASIQKASNDHNQQPLILVTACVPAPLRETTQPIVTNLLCEQMVAQVTRKNNR